MDNNEKEIKIVDIQLYTLLFTLITSFISIIITYNQKRQLKGKKGMFTSKEIYNLTLFNRIAILVISLTFFYVNYSLYKISKEQNEDLEPYKLQLIASLLVILSGIIALYVVSLSNKENISDIENPII